MYTVLRPQLVICATATRVLPPRDCRSLLSLARRRGWAAALLPPAGTHARISDIPMPAHRLSSAEFEKAELESRAIAMVSACDDEWLALPSHHGE